MAVFAVWFLLLLPVYSASTSFIESPTSQNVSIAQEAVFRCQHSTADTIRWQINGSLISRSNLPEGVGLDAEGLVEILTITGRLDYNGTVVQCVARFDSGLPDDISNPALLTVVADTNSTNNTAGGFLTSPLSVNVTVGNETMFYCKHSNAVAFSWLINGTALISQTDLHSTFIEGTNGRVRTLTVTAHSQYNSTTIECSAFFSNGQPSETTPPASLLIQGLLDAVNILTRVTTTIILWEPPFSLDLTNVEPDIVYCVDVYNITCGGRDLVSSDCSVTDTSYTSLSDGYLYEYIVTPRSNVEGAQNGTESNSTDKLPRFEMSSSKLSLANTPSYRVGLNYTPVVPIPSSYTLSLEALDGLSDLDHVEATATEIQPMLVLDVAVLEFRRLWNCFIMTYGCIENSILRNEMLSTYDFRDINISASIPNVVGVTGRFIEDSPTIGVLVIVSSDTRSYYHNVSRDGSGLQSPVLTDIPGGEYIVSVFVVEENGLPFERAAMMPSHLSVDGNDVQQSSPTIEYAVESNSTGVCVQCNFLATDAPECIAVVHRNLTNIESRLSRKFTRSGNTASGCIEGVNLEDYQVGVVGGRLLESGLPHSNNLTVIIITLMATVTLLAVIVIVLSIIVKVHYRKLRSRPRHGDFQKMPNLYYTSVPAPPTDNSHVPSVDRSVGIYGNICSFSPSADPSQPHAVSTSDRSAPIYSQVDVKPEAINIPPVEDEAVVYSMVLKTQGANDLLYAMVNPKKSTRDSYPDDLTKVLYSKIRPHGVEQPPQAASAVNILAVPPPTPVTADNVMAALLPVASKWRAIGEAFNLSEKRLEDIETTERDEQCLQEMIETYMLNGDLNHTWDEIVDVLKKIEEDSLAEQIFDLHVSPYVLTLPNQPQLPDSGVYTHGSKPSPRLHMVPTNDRNLDADSPVLSGQQTEPATSVICENEIKPESLPTTGVTHESHCAPTPTPFKTGNVVAALLPVASKWRAIGEAFSLSEKRLDEFETTEGDEQCLWEMIETYMLRRDLSHTWDEIVDVLMKIEEDSLAEKIFNVHVAPYVLTLPNQPHCSASYVYTHGSQSLPDLPNMCTDDGNLDMSLPVLSHHQHTVSVTSVTCEEREPSKEEFVLATNETVHAPGHQRSGCFLEMTFNEDNETSYNSHNGPNMQNSKPNSEKNMPATSDTLEMPSYDSDDTRSTTPCSRGRSPGRRVDTDYGEVSKNTEMENDSPSFTNDYATGGKNSEVKSPSSAKKSVHGSDEKLKGGIECDSGVCGDQEDSAPSENDESQNNDDGDASFISDEVDKLPKASDNTPDNSQEGEKRRYGSGLQEKASSQQTESVLIVLHKQMEYVNNDLVLPSPSRATDEVQTARQKEMPHRNDLCRQLERRYVFNKTDLTQRRGTLIFVHGMRAEEVPNEPVEAADMLPDAVCDDDNTQPEKSCRELVPVYDDNVQNICDVVDEESNVVEVTFTNLLFSDDLQKYPVHLVYFITRVFATVHYKKPAHSIPLRMLILVGYLLVYETEVHTCASSGVPEIQCNAQYKELADGVDILLKLLSTEQKKKSLRPMCDEEWISLKWDPPNFFNKSEAFMNVKASEINDPCLWLLIVSPISDDDEKRVERASIEYPMNETPKFDACNVDGVVQFMVLCLLMAGVTAMECHAHKKHLKSCLNSSSYQPLTVTDAERCVVTYDEKQGGLFTEIPAEPAHMDGFLNFTHALMKCFKWFAYVLRWILLKYCTWIMNCLKCMLCSYLRSKYVQNPCIMPSNRGAALTCDLQVASSIGGVCVVYSAIFGCVFMKTHPFAFRVHFKEGWERVVRDHNCAVANWPQLFQHGSI